MANYQMTFQRYEIKYLLDGDQYHAFRRRLEGKMAPDRYGRTTICNVYFDTKDSRLIRTSLEKPVYKEKLRLRSYGTPNRESTVFVELKKKYKGIVYKRRENMLLSEAEAYLYRGSRPDFDSQVLHEIDWFLAYYRTVAPAMYISYERTAWEGLEDPGLRLTFDGSILWREEDLDLKSGSRGTPILKPGQKLMEIKTPGAMPLWLGKLLDQERIYPVSFSKYGKAYEARFTKEKEQRGGIHCA